MNIYIYYIYSIYINIYSFFVVPRLMGFPLILMTKDDLRNEHGHGTN